MMVSIIAAFWAEALVPLERRSLDVGHVLRNLALWCLAFLLADVLIGVHWLDLQSLLPQQSFGLFYWWPLPAEWLLIPVGLLLGDLADYLLHRVMHASPLLWRLHSVHHSDTLLDVSTAMRFHPLEMVLSNMWKIGLLFCFGIPIWILGLRELLMWPLIFLQHANVRLPASLEHKLGRMLVMPSVHRHHHSIRRSEHDSNYGEGLIWWDKLFRTYQAPLDQRPQRYGVEGMQNAVIQTVPGMLLAPFRRLDMA